MVELTTDASTLNAALAEKAIISVEVDAADVIALGCTGFFDCAEAMRTALAAAGHDVQVAESYTGHRTDRPGARVTAGLGHTKAAYPQTGGESLVGYDLTLRLET